MTRRTLALLLLVGSFGLAVAAGPFTGHWETELFLADIEREHRISLQDSLSYLEDPESWLEASEHQGLDGA